VGEEVDGREIINETVAEMTGGAVTLDMVEQFVGEEVSLDRIMDFVGDVREDEINEFMNELSTMDQESLNALAQEFEGEVTYEKLEEKLGNDFTLEDIMDYIRNFQ
jgi:hypothetical protein